MPLIFHLALIAIVSLSALILVHGTASHTVYTASTNLELSGSLLFIPSCTAHSYLPAAVLLLLPWIALHLSSAARIHVQWFADLQMIEGSTQACFSRNPITYPARSLTNSKVSSLFVYFEARIHLDTTLQYIALPLGSKAIHTIKGFMLL